MRFTTGGAVYAIIDAENRTLRGAMSNFGRLTALPINTLLPPDVS